MNEARTGETGAIAAEDLLGFWLGEVGPDRWYAVDPDLDALIRLRFLVDWEQARAGAFDSWTAQPRGSLALIVLLDQFPRNMFRDDPRAFASDARALAAAKSALARGFDLRVAEPERRFFYLPLMHSERVADQERSVRLFALHLPGDPHLEHARAHRAVIRRFGRFPYRNAVLGRTTTAAEAAWLESGGYKSALAEVA